MSKKKEMYSFQNNLHYIYSRYLKYKRQDVRIIIIFNPMNIFIYYDMGISC